MSITSITTDVAGQTGVNPRRVKIVCDNIFDELTAAGFLNSAESLGYTFYPTDFFDIAYGTNSESLGMFTSTISGGIITLTGVNNGTVTLPVTDDHLAAFSGTSGLIDDSGIAASAVAQFTGSTVSGNIPKFNNTTGQLIDSGAKLLCGTTSSWTGGGTSHGFAVTGLSASSQGACVINASTNAVSIAKAVCTTNTLTITFSSDPGTGTTISYFYSTASLS